MTYKIIMTGQGFDGENAKHYLATQIARNEQHRTAIKKQLSAEGGAYGEPVWVTIPEQYVSEFKAEGFEIIEVGNEI